MERKSPAQRAGTPPVQATGPASDAHYRMMMEAMKDLVIFTTDATGLITAWTAGAGAVLGWPAAEAVGRDVRFLTAEEDKPRSAIERDIARAFAKRSCRLSRWHVRKDGSRIFLEGTIRPMQDGSAQLVWTARDATDELIAQDKQKHAVAQLQHRMRNVLANVRSIIHRSSRTSESVEELAMHLEGRMDCLARIQLMLTRDPGTDPELEDVVREELLAHAVPDFQLDIQGPPVRLAPRAAEIIMFALHELATNAIKYGALLTDKGRIAITWKVEQAQGEAWLKLRWTESGVRVAAVAPRREGFGSELVARRIPYELSGRGSIELRPGGIHAVIEFPLRPSDSILAQAGQDPPASGT